MAAWYNTEIVTYEEIQIYSFVIIYLFAAYFFTRNLIVVLF